MEEECQISQNQMDIDNHISEQAYDHVYSIVKSQNFLITKESFEKFKRFFGLTEQDCESLYNLRRYISDVFAKWNFRASYPVRFRTQVRNASLGRDTVPICQYKLATGDHFMNLHAPAEEWLVLQRQQRKMSRAMKRWESMKYKLADNIYSPMNVVLNEHFRRLLVDRKMRYEDLENKDELFDQLLIEATCLAFQKMRVPGRYIYDTTKGEKTLEDYNKEKMAEYERRLDRF